MGPSPQRRQWVWTMTHLGLWGGGSHGIHPKVCNKKTSRRLSQTCLPAPAKQKHPPGVLVLNPVSPSLRSFFLPCWATCSVFPEQTDPSCCGNRTTHITWGLMEVPSPAHSSPEGVHSEVSVCWGLHTHTAPQTVPTQAPCKFWREDHLSQIWSFTQRCVHCDVHLWLRRSSFPFTFPSWCLCPMPSSDILGLGELSSLPSLKQNHKNEWIYIAKSVSFQENFLEWKKKLSNGIPETSIR